MDLASLTIVTDTFCTEIRNAGYQAGLYFNQQLGYEGCICRACRRTRSGWLNTTIRHRLPITLTSGSILPPARSTALRATSI